MSEIMAEASSKALNEKDVLSKFQEILSEILALEGTETLTPDARLREDLHIDSLGMVDIVIGIEQAFGVKIESDTNIFERLETISDAVKLVMELAVARR